MATNEQLTTYYAELLISQYRNKPKARAHIKALANIIIMNQMPLAVQKAFNVNNCVGVQLDVVGKYVGAHRIITGPNNIKITLSDDDFRVIIKLAIVRNNAVSSLADIETMLVEFFGSKILITDNATMQLNYFITSDIGSSDLQYAIVYGDYLPRPMGVEVAAIIVPPLTHNYFGMRTYFSAGTNISPLNTYDFYNTTYPWFSYFIL
jgi:hypothetical protein